MTFIILLPGMPSYFNETYCHSFIPAINKSDMNNNDNITPSNSPSRRKFVLGLGAFSLFATVAAAVGFPLKGSKHAAPVCKPIAKKKTMLTQDGQLVEIDEELIAANSKKVSNSELQNWIKK